MYDYAKTIEEAEYFLITRANETRKVCKKLKPLSNSNFFTKNTRFIYDSVIYFYDSQNLVFKQENLSISSFSLSDIKCYNDFINYGNTSNMDWDDKQNFMDDLKNLIKLQNVYLKKCKKQFRYGFHYQEFGLQLIFAMCWIFYDYPFFGILICIFLFIEVFIIEFFKYMIQLNYKKPVFRNVIRLNNKDGYETDKKEVIVGDIYYLNKGDYTFGDCILLKGDETLVVERLQSENSITLKKTPIEALSYDNLNVT